VNPPVDPIKWVPENICGRTPAAGAPFSCTHAGWTIETPPPDIRSSGLHGRGLAGYVLLQRASSGFVPWETINPRAAAGTHLSSVAPVYRVDGNEFWSTVWCFSSRPIKFTLAIPRRCDITFSLVMRACQPMGCTVDVIVNGYNLETYQPTHDLWFMLDIKIPARLLQSGTNYIVLETPVDTRRAPLQISPARPAVLNARPEIPFGIWIQSASVTSPSVPLSVSFQWVPVCSGLLNPDEELHLTVQITQGNMSSTAETESFARQLDIEVNSSENDLLSNLSELLTHAYSWGTAAHHPVSLEAAHTIDYPLHIGPAGDQALAYRVWQLDLIFEANGRRIVQALGLNGPIITQQSSVAAPTREPGPDRSA
jgi:hypothetical protein